MLSENDKLDAEKYVRNKLTLIEIEAFEKKIQYEEELYEYVEFLKNVSNAVQPTVNKQEQLLLEDFAIQFKKEEKQKKRILFTIFLTTLIATLMLLFYYLSYNSTPKKTTKHSSNPIVEVIDLSDIEISADTLLSRKEQAKILVEPEKRSEKEVKNTDVEIKTKPKIYALQEANGSFHPIKVKDDYMNSNSNRLSEATILSPYKYVVYKDSLIFEWKGELNEGTKLSIFTNYTDSLDKAYNVLLPLDTTRFMLNVQLHPDLYYWEIKDQDNTLYGLGKFRVN